MLPLQSKMECVLELRGVSKRYAEHLAVDEVSIELQRGGLYCLLGPSGCGKTSTLRLIAGFEEPSAGDILLNGVRINEHRPYERNVSTVFQSYALFPHMTVRGNIEFGLRRKGAPDMAKRVNDLLDMVELAGKENRHPPQLSGGERQRVALARSLALEPDVLLLDEPLSALDPRLRKQVRSELKNLQRRVGITFLFITHDQEEALSLSDRIAVMNRGRLEQIGTPQEIYLKPRTRFVAGFLAAVNWIDGIGVRPEATRVCRESPPSGARTARANVVTSMFLGNCLHVEAKLESGQAITAEVSRFDNGLAPGDSVHIWWETSDEMSFPSESA